MSPQRPRPKVPGTTGTSAKDRLLDAAGKLFYDRGINATGIDTVIKQAGVAKMSLYNNFKSKDDLILHYVQKRHQEWLELYERRAENAHTPKEHIKAVFDAYADHAELEESTDGFKGCGLLNAAAELDPGSQARNFIKQHKEMVEARILRHISEIPKASERDDSELAEMLSFLLEGSMARAGLEGRSDKIKTAWKIAEKMIDNLNHGQDPEHEPHSYGD